MRILQLATYPSRIPRHGGQARVASIRAVLVAAGHEVLSLAVYEPENYGGDAIESHDIVFPVDSAYRHAALPYLNDYASGQFLAGDEAAYRAFMHTMKRFAPDIVILEQPWLFPGFERWQREHPGQRVALAYSSQNIEAPLKREILAGQPGRLVDDACARIEKLQREASRAALLTIACTEDDAAVLRAFGARRVLAAGNGIVERKVEARLVADWKWHLGERRFALFVGSAYPPNGDGFWEMFSPSLAFLAPDQRILGVGGVCGIVTAHPTYKQWEGINASRLIPAGLQSEEALGALVALASCIVLPITKGGGSNIKTAEAVHSGKPVIGTSKSFRGYERILGLPDVYRVDEPAQFRRLTRAALDGALPPAGPDDAALRDSVLWRETLKALPAEFAALASARIGNDAHARLSAPRTFS
jgi:hypothetical protein